MKSKPISKVGALCVSQPIEIRSTHVSSMEGAVSAVTGLTLR
jgi:hypothetical protein